MKKRLDWHKAMRWLAGSVAGVGLAWLLGGCGAPAPGTSAGLVPSDSSRMVAPSDGLAAKQRETRPAIERPGLATGWGRELQVGGGGPMRPFARSSSKPVGTDVIYYNDQEGVEAMTSWKYRTDAMREAAGGLIEWGVKTGWSMAPTYQSDGRRFVVGRLNQEYSILVRNKCKSRVEVVLSVDGLDVLDGRPASVRKGGYVIDPGKSVEVKGFRTGYQTVAAFRFSTVGGSYANLKYGQTRNVGVIGMAVFGELGFDPWTWMPREVNKRSNARPFAEAP